MEKVEELKKLERVGKFAPCVFSFGGFFKNTIEFLKENKIAWSGDSRWLDKCAQVTRAGKEKFAYPYPRPKRILRRGRRMDFFRGFQLPAVKHQRQAF